jgi:hypothetical protein
MSAPAPDDTIALLLRSVVLEVFDERDAAKRADAIPRVFATDAEFIESTGTRRGQADIDAAVVKIHERFPGYRFRLTSEPQTVPNGGRITWGFGPPEVAPRVTGMDIAVVEDGRVALLITFVDPKD